MNTHLDTANISELNKMLRDINKTKATDWEFQVDNIEVGNETQRRIQSKYPPRLKQLLQGLKKDCFDKVNTESAYNIGKLSNTTPKNVINDNQILLALHLR
jgi:hypothetical protein